MTFDLNVKKHHEPFFFALRKLLFQVTAQQLAFKSPIVQALFIKINVVSAIDIATLEVIFVVAQNNAVGVKHGNDPDLEIGPQLVADKLIRKQVVEDAMDHKTAISNAWVLPANYHDDRSLTVAPLY